MAGLLFNVVIAAMLLWLAWRIITTSNVFEAVVLFIVYGLLMAIAWVRLDAPDIALAEAAIGAGITGVLFLDAAGHLKEKGGTKAGAGDAAGHIVLPLIAVAALLLVWAVASLPGTGGLSSVVGENIDGSGVAHPVTAVLLSFRGYDTLLEIAVLFLSVLGIYSLRRIESSGKEPMFFPIPLLASYTRIVAPLMVLVSVYLLYAGAFGPGGAFQSGVMLAAAGVLIRLSGLETSTRARGWVVSFFLAVGLSVFLLAGSGGMLLGQNFLEFPPDIAGTIIIIIETMLALSIGFILYELFESNLRLGSMEHRR